MNIVLTAPTTLHVTDARGRSTRSELSYNSDMPITTPSRPPSLQHLFEADLKVWRRTVSKGRAYNVKMMWRKHCTGHSFIEQPINCATEQSALAFLLDLELGDDARGVILTIFRKLAKQAIRNGYLRYSPFDDVKLPRKPKGARRIKYWDPVKEIPAIFAACNTEQRDAFGCMYFGGLRRGDVKSLDWDHIDFEQNTITFYTPKSGRIETIAMPTDLRAILLARHKRMGEPENGIVFPSTTGLRYERNYDWGVNEVVERAGIKKNGRSCHAFRHSCAVAAASGVWGEPWTESEVAALLRDTSEAVRVYFTLLGTHKQAKARAVKPQLAAWGISLDTPARVTTPTSNTSTSCEDCTLPLS